MYLYGGDSKNLLPTRSSWEFGKLYMLPCPKWKMLFLIEVQFRVEPH